MYVVCRAFVRTESHSLTHTLPLTHSPDHTQIIHAAPVRFPQQVAAKQFAAAAEKGDAKAHFRLAMCYKTGTGVAAEPEAAWEHFRTAADMGFAPAVDILAGIARAGPVGMPPARSNGL